MTPNLNNEDRPLPEEGVDFDYIELKDKPAETKNPAVILYGEEYDGILVQYGKIGLDIESMPPKVQFDFMIVRGNAKNKIDDLKNNANFKNLLGDIIMATIVDMARRKEAEENESGNNDPKVVS